MMRYDRPRWRLICLLRQQLMIRRRRQIQAWAQAAAMPHAGLDRHRQLQRSLAHSAGHNLERRALQVHQQMLVQLADLQAVLESSLQQLRKPLAAVPGLRELKGEVDALDDEFDHVTCDLPKRMIEVRTGAIELEGVQLGPFALQLHLDDMTREPVLLPLNVLALEPHPAAGQESVTHPHVSDERLCAGDAHNLLQRTLSEGRISEFFMIARQVLETYNRHSPYVPIDEWHGQPCDDCGVRLDDEDCCSCEGCDRTCCHECMASCRQCDELLCCSCLDRCRSCEQLTCPDCLDRCQACDRSMCPGCMSEQICPSCREDEQPPDQPQLKDHEHEHSCTNQERRPPLTASVAPHQPPLPAHD